MPLTSRRVSSGLPALDRFLGSLSIGENVVWYDEAGSLAFPFCRHFIQESISRQKPVVHVSFDRSPRNLLDNLGELAESQHLTILDCFTNGKGDSSDVFAAFYQKNGAQWPYRVIQVERPAEPDRVAEAIYGLHQDLSGDVRFIFESLTGMQALWGGEEQINRFYSRSCPKLYELETIAYWIMEKGAHSDRLKSAVNQIAQVVIDLSMQRGKAVLTLLKAERRRTDRLNAPHTFWSDGRGISFEGSMQEAGGLDLGMRIKSFRSSLGLSQKELAGLVEVTPSTISQIESNTTYPSLPALLRIAEALNLNPEVFFRNDLHREAVGIHPFSGSIPLQFKALPQGAIRGFRLTPLDLDIPAVPCLLEIAPQTTLPGHFFVHKGPELGHLISGRLIMHVKQTAHTVHPGDTITLQRDVPSQWMNPDDAPARLLWLTL